ncbi:MAG: hypothetical protein FJ276_37850, partial [Planctomycetes bacterium]|nr:hypothetical protein [Planctomycetota bacterium]
DQGRLSQLDVDGQPVMRNVRYDATDGRISEAVCPAFRYRRTPETPAVTREVLSPQGSAAGRPVNLWYANGRLASLRGPGGLQLDVQYAGGRVVGVNTPRGTIRVTGDDRRRTITAPNGDVIQVVLDDRCRIQNIVTSSHGARREAQFRDGRLSSCTDFDQGERRYEWDATSGTLQAVTDAAGATVRYRHEEHDGDRRLVAVVLPNQRSIGFKYDSKGRLTEVVE